MVWRVNLANESKWSSTANIRDLMVHHMRNLCAPMNEAQDVHRTEGAVSDLIL